MIYIFCFILSTSFAWLASRSKERAAVFIWSALSILVLCVLGGLRDPFYQIDFKYFYGWSDYLSAGKSGSFAELIAAHPDREREIGYFFICYLSAKVFRHENWALFFFQLITVTCVYIGAYKHRKYISLPFFMLVFCFTRYNRIYNIMRQPMACAIIFMGLDALEEKKYLKFSLYILAGTLFHNSAVLAFPLLIGVHMVMTSKTVLKNSWLKIFIMLGVAAVLFAIRPLMRFTLDNVVNTMKYSSYIEERYGARITSVEFIRILILSTELLLLTFYRKRADKVLMPSGGGGVSFYQFNLMLSTTYYIVIRLLSDRILMYTDYADLFVLAALPSFIKEKHLRALVLLGVIAVLVLHWYILIVVKGFSQSYPYHSILE